MFCIFNFLKRAALWKESVSPKKSVASFGGLYQLSPMMVASGVSYGTIRQRSMCLLRQICMQGRDEKG
jgi:hypothetical protein